MGDVHITINTLDARGVEDVLKNNRGAIVKFINRVASDHGKRRPL